MNEADERERSMFSRSGNRYRYSGRTEYQTRLAADQIPRTGNEFNRVAVTGKGTIGKDAGLGSTLLSLLGNTVTVCS